ncbi:MAG: preprotein translocase subunit SecG [bacterium]
MNTILVVVHLFLAIGLIGLILIQHGKGADAGAAFGAGASATVFGSQGSANFLSRATAILAVLFFVTSMALAAIALKESREQTGLMEQAGQPAAATDTAIPQAPTPAADVPAIPSADIPAVPETGSGDVPAVPADVPMGSAINETPEESAVTANEAPADIPEVPGAATASENAVLEQTDAVPAAKE